MDRAVADLSGGELQRFATAVVCIQVTHCATERLPVACIDENLLRVAMLVRKTDLSGLCWKRFEFGGLTDCSKLTCTCSTNPHRTSMSNSASPLLVYANTSHPEPLAPPPPLPYLPCPPLPAHIRPPARLADPCVKRLTSYWCNIGDSAAPHAGDLRRSGRARPVGARLPLRLYLLPVRCARRIRYV
jgi:hypothetical protein